MFYSAMFFGLFGVIAAPALAILLTTPVRISFVQKHKGWNPLSDIGFLVLGVVINGCACWLDCDKIEMLIK